MDFLGQVEDFRDVVGFNSFLFLTLSRPLCTTTFKGIPLNVVLLDWYFVC